MVLCIVCQKQLLNIPILKDSCVAKLLLPAQFNAVTLTVMSELYGTLRALLVDSITVLHVDVLPGPQSDVVV